MNVNFPIIMMKRKVNNGYIYCNSVRPFHSIEAKKSLKSLARAGEVPNFQHVIERCFDNQHIHFFS